MVKEEYKEYHSPHSGLFLTKDRVLFRERSRFQEIEIFENGFFGRVLTLDGLVMTTERDEFIYHEMLVHPAMVSHPHPKKVLIVGGGDGGTAREVLKYPVKEVHMVEIDEMVIEASRKYLPTISSSLDDERLTIHVQDATVWIKDRREIFDVVIIDSTDPIGPAEGLIGEEFFEDVFESLKEDGIMVIQSESPHYHLDTIRTIAERLKKVFSHTYMYTAPIPTYPGGFWAFSLATKGLLPQFRNRYPGKLKYFNRGIFEAAFRLPQFLLDRVGDLLDTPFQSPSR